MLLEGKSTELGKLMTRIANRKIEDHLHSLDLNYCRIRRKLLREEERRRSRFQKFSQHQISEAESCKKKVAELRELLL